MKNVIKSLLTNKNKNVFVFTGAGISCESGLPLAKDLISYLIKSITPTNVGLRHILGLKDRPFESYIESMVNITGDYSIFNMFSYDEIIPNQAHNIISELLINNYIKQIYTVNFDVLHEKSLMQFGCVCHKLIKDSDFTDKTYEDQNVHLVKLHGCGTDVDNMKLVLSSVTNLNERKYRDLLTSSLFGNDENIIVILGYSASDSFDIVPAIKSVNEQKACVIYVQHSDISETPKANHTVKEAYCFSDFPGYYIKTKCKDFLSAWLKEIKLNSINPNSVIDTAFSWQLSIEKFIDSIKQNRYEILGLMYQQAGYLNDSIICYKEFINQFWDCAHPYQQLAQISLMQNNESDFINYIQKALCLAVHNEDVTTILSCQINFAEYLLRKGQYADAIQIYDGIYNVSKNFNDSIYTLYALEGLCVGYAEQYDYLNAEHYCNELVQLTADESNLKIFTDAHLNMCEIYRKKKDYKLALYHIDCVIEKKTLLNDAITLTNAYLVKANIYKDLGDIINSLNEYKNALKLSRKNKVQDLRGKIYHQIGLLLYNNEIYEVECLKYLLRSLIEFERTGNARMQLSSLEILCTFFLNKALNIRRLARPYRLEDLRNFEVISTKDCLRNYISASKYASEARKEEAFSTFWKLFGTFLSMEVDRSKSFSDSEIYERTLAEKVDQGVLIL